VLVLHFKWNTLYLIFYAYDSLFSAGFTCTPARHTMRRAVHSVQTGSTELLPTQFVNFKCTLRLFS
jgi:hypothetical protein